MAERQPSPKRVHEHSRADQSAAQRAPHVDHHAHEHHHSNFIENSNDFRSVRASMRFAELGSAEEDSSSGGTFADGPALGRAEIG